MDVILLIVVLLLVCGAFVRGAAIRDLRGDIYELRHRLDLLEGRAVDEVMGMPAPRAEDGPARWAPTPIVYADKVPQAKHVPAAASVKAEVPSASAPQSDAADSWALRMAARLPVWVGAVALAFAGFYLVRYSIEAGWFGPAVRVTGAGVVGAILTLAGDHIGRARTMANHERVAQALVGAGLAAMYGAFYAAVNLYHFLPPVAGVLCMTAVTMGAVVMALRHGQPIALFGLVAGMLTPALVGADEPQAALLFAHLFAVFAVGLMVLAHRGWWVLAGIMLTGMHLWVLLWLVQGGATDSALVLFLMALAGATAVATRTAQRQAAVTLNVMAVAGAALLIALLEGWNALGLFDWAMMMVLSLGAAVMAAIGGGGYGRLLVGKMALDMVLLCLWGHDAALPELLMVMAGLGVVYVALPQVVMGRVAEPRLWALLQGTGLAVLYGLGHAFIDMPVMTDGVWAALAAALAGMALLRVRSSCVTIARKASIWSPFTLRAPWALRRRRCFSRCRRMCWA